MFIFTAPQKNLTVKEGCIMSKKNWITFNTNANGFDIEAKFTQETVDNVFLPFLHKLTDLHAQLERKVVAYLAAPPGTGKTIITQYLEELSKQHSEVEDIKALSMDGFHFSNDYMEAHFAVVNGSTIPMKMIKGAPETFDVDGLQDKIREVKLEDVDWPIYDRTIHDVVQNAISVESEIVLIEGNYLLLDSPKWTNIRVLADYSAFIKADPAMLKHRLIERKVRSGKTQNEAEHFYHTSDGKNVELVLSKSASADETWVLESDGDIKKESICFEHIPISR